MPYQPLSFRGAPTYPEVAIQDWIYMAGFFDGEGTMGIYPHGAKPSGRRTTMQYVLNVSLVNTHKPVMDWVAETFGGGICVHTKLGAQAPSGKIRASAWNWKTNSRKARWFLENLYPYLIVKKEQAEVGIEFQRHIEEYDWRRYKEQRVGLLAIPDDIMEYRKSLAEKIKVIKASDKQYGIKNSWAIAVGK